MIPTQLSFSQKHALRLVETAEKTSCEEVKCYAKRLRQSFDDMSLARNTVLTTEGTFATKRARLTEEVANKLMTPEDAAEFTKRSHDFSERKARDYLQKTKEQRSEYRLENPSAPQFEEFRHMTRLLVCEMTILTRFLKSSVDNDGPVYYQKRTIENMLAMLDGFYKNEI